MRAKEFITEAISISKSVEGGELIGYVTTSSKPQFRNYLESQGVDDNLIQQLSTKYPIIAILRNMYVDEDYRGQGIGSDLVSDALNDAAMEGAMAMVLVADMHEGNKFDLSKWYEENFDFKIIGNAQGDPVMLREL